MTYVTLWIGGDLGPCERACLRSLHRHGPGLALYCYDLVRNVPEGIELRDAETVLPRSAIIRHQGGSVALFANRFRYELQRIGAGTWVDTDLYAIAPLPEEPATLFGLQSPDTINQAVLRLPPDSPLLQPLLDIFDEKRVPPWLHWRAKIAAHWRLWRTGATGISKMPWGSAGPIAISALAKEHGLFDCAQPIERFYPAPYQEADWVRDPARSIDEWITPGTVAVHLWNELIKAYKNEPAPPGSFLARLHAEGAE